MKNLLKLWQAALAACTNSRAATEQSAPDDPVGLPVDPRPGTRSRPRNRSRRRRQDRRSARACIREGKFGRASEGPWTGDVGAPGGNRGEIWSGAWLPKSGAACRWRMVQRAITSPVAAPVSSLTLPYCPPTTLVGIGRSANSPVSRILTLHSAMLAIANPASVLLSSIHEDLS